jgi:hypothetical protein
MPQLAVLKRCLTQLLRKLRFTLACLGQLLLNIAQLLLPLHVAIYFWVKLLRESKASLLTVGDTFILERHAAESPLEEVKNAEAHRCHCEPESV